jgi:hypothetical protein
MLADAHGATEQGIQALIENVQTPPGGFSPIDQWLGMRPGYRLSIRRHGSGWRATILAPDGRQPILGPQSDDPAGRDDVLQRARSLIDGLRGSSMTVVIV